LTYSSKLRKWKAEEAEDILDPEDQDDDIVMVDAPSGPAETFGRLQGSPAPKDAVSYPRLLWVQV